MSRFNWDDTVSALIAIVAGKSLPDAAATDGLEPEVLRAHVVRVYDEAIRVAPRSHRLPPKWPQDDKIPQATVVPLRKALRLAGNRRFNRACIWALVVVLVLALGTWAIALAGLDTPAFHFAIGTSGAAVLMAWLGYISWERARALVALHKEDADVRTHVLIKEAARARDKLAKADSALEEVDRARERAETALRDERDRMEALVQSERDKCEQLALRVAAADGARQADAERTKKVERDNETLRAASRSRKARDNENLLRVLEPRVPRHGDDWQEMIAKEHRFEVVLFADVTGFTAWASNKEPVEVAEAIGALVERVDKLSSLYGLGRLKVIGDEFMMVSRLLGHADETRKCDQAVSFAWQLTANDENKLDGLPWKIGVASGPIASAMLSHEVASIDIWGTVVNRAARLTKASILRAGSALVCNATYGHLSKQALSLVGSSENVELNLKGIGNRENAVLLHFE